MDDMRSKLLGYAGSQAVDGGAGPSAAVESEKRFAEMNAQLDRFDGEIVELLDLLEKEKRAVVQALTKELTWHL